ncbi:spore germination protein GerPE [Paenibacillus sp. UNC451MF]|uniref:spore germination protein GerPE n=1 Tax=Paenibacillus sp. UNC451MF TaxID=1449063 RepID=UPI00068E057C|nr:spore germination protein GerPE [Paenibacillus sp. UNC451MF]
MNRWSIVKYIKVFNVSEASIIQIGDNKNNRPSSRVIAVQREVADFKGDEGNFEQLPLFSREIPLPDVTETVDMKIDHVCDTIKVGKVTVLGIVASSVFQVGTNETIEAESRVKQFRQLVTDKNSSLAKMNGGEQAKPTGEEL